MKSDEANKPRYGINESDEASNYNVYSTLMMYGYVTAGLRTVGNDSKYDADSIVGSIVTS